MTETDEFCHRYTTKHDLTNPSARVPQGGAGQVRWG